MLKLLEKLFDLLYEQLVERLTHAELLQRLAEGDMSRAARYNLVWDGLLATPVTIFIIIAAAGGRLDLGFQALLVLLILAGLCLAYVALGTPDRRAG